MGLLGYAPSRILELQRRAQAVADHLAGIHDPDPLAADAVGVARAVHRHVAQGWLPALARVAASTAMIAAFTTIDVGGPDPRPRGVIGSVVDGLTEEERTYLQGFVDASASSVALELSRLAEHPDYATDRLPDALRTLDSPGDWGWLAQLYLVEQYHEMIAAGDVEAQRDGDVYWVDPLDLLDVRSEVMSEIVLAAVTFPGNVRPGGAISRATARTAGSPAPAPRDITAPRQLAHLDDPARFDPASLEHYTYDQLVRSLDATDWNRSASRSGNGLVFDDTARFGRQIRVMPGYPSGTRPDPRTFGPYAVVSQNGRRQKVLLADNPARTSAD